MAKVSLSFAAHGPSWSALINNALNAYGRDHHITTKSVWFAWEEIWKQLVDISVHKSETDISEAGSTWVVSLVSMNSLRPFRASEIARIGGGRFQLVKAIEHLPLEALEAVI